MSFKTIKCWPRTFKYIISPKIVQVSNSICNVGADGHEIFTVGLTPFVVNKPRFNNWNIKNVSEKWVALGPGGKGRPFGFRLVDFFYYLNMI